MIEVSHVSKEFNGVTVIDNIDFVVDSRQMVGFLGTNGAGKTTTMRMIVGYLKPSQGTMRVAGHDVVEEPLEVKKNIGYLAEHNPLYTELRVHEYLKFRAELKGVSKSNIRARVADVLDKCWINDVEHRIIGQLSKGYRQRVGLADALIHNPDVLILDEPTSGLDPYQIIKTRELIKSLADEHTILFSSHILPEVEMLCDTIMIIKNGQIVAQGTAEELKQSARTHPQVNLVIEGSVADDMKNLLSQIKDVIQVIHRGAHAQGERFELVLEDGSDVQKDIFQLVSEQSWTIVQMSSGETRLEDLFVQITMNETTMDVLNNSPENLPKNFEDSEDDAS